jgi:hypothetical protein
MLANVATLYKSAGVKSSAPLWKEDREMSRNTHVLPLPDNAQITHDLYADTGEYTRSEAR